MSIWASFISTVVLAGTLRIGAPLIIGALGGCFTYKAGTFFMGYEALMLTAAFFGTLGSYLTGNALAGILLGVITSMLLVAVFGWLVFMCGSNGIIISIALNNGAWALTTFLLLKIFGVRGSFIDSRIVSFKTIHFPLPDKLKWINEVFNDKIGIVYIALLLIVVCWFMIYRTPFGLRLRGIGINAKAAQSTGTNLTGYRWGSLLIMAAFCGVAGAEIPLSGISMFSENMTSGRGFLVMAAVLVGDGNPVKTGLIALLFAYTDALYLTFSSFHIPTQLLSMVPYLAVILVLVVSSMKKRGTRAVRLNEK